MKSEWKDFFKDARGAFSAFTVISLGAGATLVTSPLVCRLLGWTTLTRDEIYCLTLLYCISALSDALLGIYLNKAPDTLAVQTGDSPTINTTPDGIPANPNGNN